VADKTYLHVGLPKTGTTYLQSIVWSNRERLMEQGLLVPGSSPRQHLWASGVVREDPNLARRGEEAVASWAALVSESAEWPGRALVSHEFFGGASTEQAARAVAALEPAEVHVVVTARDPLAVVSSYWQEYVKHGFDADLDDFPPTQPDNPANEWSWRAVDLVGVLERWGAAVPPDRVHVLVLPGYSAPPEALWQDFATLLDVDPCSCDVDAARANHSLGVVEAELLRRVSRQLEGFGTALDRGVWIRGYLAHEKLVDPEGERFLPSEARVAELRDRAVAATTLIRARGFDVRGDLDRLLVPEDLPARRHPAEVTDQELLDAATSTIAGLMTDIRELRRENTQLRREQEPVPPPPTQRRTLRDRLRRLVTDVARRAR
jgi:hypothetical protein